MSPRRAIQAVGRQVDTSVMGARQGKIAAAAAGVLLVVGLVAAYLATLPEARPYHRPVIRVAAADPNADLAAQAQAEQSYNRNEKRTVAAETQARATDTPLVDVCTGKPITSGPTVDIHDKKLDCPPPPPPKATRGAHEAVAALEHECIATKRKPGAVEAASAYLVKEAHTRPTYELADLLYSAANTELDCYRSAKELNIVGSFIGAMEHIENELRPYNRFLDGAGKKKERKRAQHLATLRRRVS